MCVHHALRIEPHKIRLQQNCFVFYRKLKLAQALVNHCEQILFVARGFADHYTRSGPRKRRNELAITLVHRTASTEGCFEKPGQRRAGSSAKHTHASTCVPSSASSSALQSCNLRFASGAVIPYFS